MADDYCIENDGARRLEMAAIARETEMREITAFRARLAKAEMDCRSYQAMAEDAINRMDRAVADRQAWDAATKKAQTEAVDQTQRAEKAEAALADAYRMGLEAGASACESQKAVFLSPEYATNQPLSSYSERVACAVCTAAIRALPVPTPAEILAQIEGQPEPMTPVKDRGMHD